MSQDIWEWWLDNHGSIPEPLYYRMLEEYFPQQTEPIYHYRDVIYPTQVSDSKIAKPVPLAKDVAMRKGLMYGARKLLPRAVPYVGWGLLAKDIYDFFKD